MLDEVLLILGVYGLVRMTLWTVFAAVAFLTAPSGAHSQTVTTDPMARRALSPVGLACLAAGAAGMFLQQPAPSGALTITLWGLAGLTLVAGLVVQGAMILVLPVVIGGVSSATRTVAPPAAQESVAAVPEPPCLPAIHLRGSRRPRPDRPEDLLGRRHR